MIMISDPIFPLSAWGKYGKPTIKFYRLLHRKSEFLNIQDITTKMIYSMRFSESEPEEK